MRNCLCRDDYRKDLSASEEVFPGAGISSDRQETAHPPLPIAPCPSGFKDKNREEDFP